MNVVWYAIGIYVVGVAVVLYVRPAVMFHPGGAWKEFGVSKEGGYTVFPFWMFAMVWSLVSYAFASLAAMFFASMVMKSVAAASDANSIAQPISATGAGAGAVATAPAALTVAPLTAAPLTAPAAPISNLQFPGYYVLDPRAMGFPAMPTATDMSAMSAPMAPRYFYWGPEPPKGA